MAFAAALLKSSVFPGCRIVIFSLAVYLKLPFLLKFSHVGGVFWPRGVVLFFSVLYLMLPILS